MTNTTEAKTKATGKRGPNRTPEQVFQAKVSDLEKKIAYHEDFVKSFKSDLKKIQSEKQAREKREKDMAAEKINALRAELARLEAL